ncbi:MAG TPA: succinate dehydrogenase assembly factor 2 [Acidiphilium sp.]|nr:MAG: succinate dehydrogenase assembly factor 2 [Acidiphilium sp. 21-60-14]OYV90178.1 MAG: succinate dehydrogenase assembly factor 2 [Acidiphilium sp. 37-60-79]OZB41205.1 MAG: succinate dehydrogenase assembly factor 2 [Acidiphilium sp. 34-60-192]HQT89369.1 succinate dehydrogenase assembly factor 2 [Acidiphilium sp.]HQU24901.1 succinate dehydrogenase assembly factor 2 [Acidiphilium sp.]
MIPDPPQPDPHPALIQRRKRVLYRATHRGTYENDLMIGGFAHRHVATMDDAALDAFEALMEFPDVDLADWLTGRLPIPDHADSPLLRQIQLEAPDVAQAKTGR